MEKISDTGSIEKENAKQAQTQNESRPAKLRSLRTLRSDLSETARKGEFSLTDIYLRQQSQNPYGAQNPKAGFFSQNKISALIAGIALIILASAGTYFLFFKKTETEQIPAKFAPQPILASQVQKTIEFKTKNDFSNQVKSSLSQNFTIGEIVYLPIKKAGEESSPYAGSVEFLKFFGGENGNALSPYLENRFFLGIMSLNENVPVLIFEIKNGKYENAFAGMLKWEKNILSDLNFLFEEDSLAKPLTDAAFSDKIVSNQNARTAEQNGETKFIYALFNKKYIVITLAEEQFKEIIQELELAP